jgi:dipeptidyl aminopeptidase/acylaminoacyl peptidase
MKKSTLLLFYILPLIGFGQKKTMTPEVYKIWNRISDKSLSNDGLWTLYTVHPEKGNKRLYINNNQDGKQHNFPRASKPEFDYNSETVVFLTQPDYDTQRDLKRTKTPEKKLPKDTLSMWHLKTSQLVTVPNVKSFELPEKWGKFVAYLLEPDISTPDSLLQMKRESKEDGSKLILQNLATSQKDTLHYVTDYVFAEEGKGIAAFSKGTDDSVEKGVYVYDFDTKKWQNIFSESESVSQLSWSKDAQFLAFISEEKASKDGIKDNDLVLYEQGKEGIVIADSNADFLADNHMISHHESILFSEDNRRMVFGIKPHPLLQDTSLLDDEIVNVEVWTYSDDILYTRNEENLEDDKKRSFEVLYDLSNKTFSTINDSEYEQVIFDENMTNDFAIGIERTAYERYVMWEGTSYFDGYRMDLKSGQKTKFTSKEQGSVRLSPKGNYAIWYNNVDSVYYSYDVIGDKKYQLTSNSIGTFYDEENDRPMPPRSYGIAGFSQDEKHVFIYDRYDIWKVSLNNQNPPEQLTSGRENQIEYRIIDLDQEETAIDLEDHFWIRSFNDKDKSSGYHTLGLESNDLTSLFSGPYEFSNRPIKAKDADVLITTKESFDIFPDLILTNSQLEDMNVISNANPQQKDYNWGQVKMHSWKTYDEKDGTGLIFFPEGFDRNKKYPLLVNFYERSSDRLHRHRAPYAHRSTINYTYYLSKGFVIFNPDVYYREGEPGQSCYDAVVPGVESLIAEGYIDEENIGVQGHSWGGYQIADMLTKTDIFKCAESGAPVVNMVSAYGGIRWGSGRSRMFQYERTQSRLGATLWERPDLYLKNSPIFDMDKMNTPVLILHNDKDGAVPWYQGIEYFNALRRLGKPAWFLNYNDEPHWPVKWQNKLDFNIRMEQFFDHYLLGKPMPIWMREGVSPMQKGIEQGLELEDRK